MSLKSKNGFTLVELLVVLALIGMLTTLTVLGLRNARRETRDAERARAANQITVGLSLGFVQLASYPSQSEGDLRLGDSGARALCEVGGKPQFIENVSQCTGQTFLNPVPASPTPADGSCTPVQNVYRYRAGSGGTDFKFEFCLGKAAPQSGLADGLNCATPDGIKAGACQ